MIFYILFYVLLWHVAEIKFMMMSPLRPLSPWPGGLCQAVQTTDVPLQAPQLQLCVQSTGPLNGTATRLSSASTSSQWLTARCSSAHQAGPLKAPLLQQQRGGRKASTRPTPAAPPLLQPGSNTLISSAGCCYPHGAACRFTS